MRAIACLMMMLCANLAWATSITELQGLVQTPMQLSGHFTQDKYLATVDTSLKSSGTFAYIAGEEVIWHTLAPIENTLTLTPNQIISSHNGQQMSIMEGQNNPVVRIFSDIFFGVMTANWGLLQAYFNIEADIHQAQWQTQLTPNDTSIAQAITGVTLSGTIFLEKVELHEVNGNTTTIQFSDLTSEDSH